MVELVRTLKESNWGVTIYDFGQGMSLSFICDEQSNYHITAEVYGEGLLNKDKTLTFYIHKSNMELYTIFSNFFQITKDISSSLRSGKRAIYFKPFVNGVLCYNTYDTYKLYDKENNQIKWKTEEEEGINKHTCLYIKQYQDNYAITFKNERLAELDENATRNITILNKGSKSFVFPYLFWDFFLNLNQLPTTLLKEDAIMRILKR